MIVMSFAEFTDHVAGSLLRGVIDVLVEGME
jgi:hypothetical protein